MGELLAARARAERAAVGLRPRRPIETREVNGVPFLLVSRNATLPDLRAVAPGAVRTDGRGRWTVSRTILVTRGATLTIRQPEVRVLRLHSGRAPYAAILAWNARLRFSGTRTSRLQVTSFDPATRGPDHRPADGRALVSLTGRGRLDAADVEFSHLGYSSAGPLRGRVSGVAAYAAVGSTRRPTGTIVRSVFAHNYFGAYTHNARDMRWLDNRFVHNVVYGFDPHTGSSGFLVEGNYAAANGRHGIIFSHSCDGNVIQGNVSEHNAWHGIVIDDGSPNRFRSRNNLIVDNVVRQNGGAGISLDGSVGTTVFANRVEGGVHGIRVLRRSSGTVIDSNTITGTSRYGVLIAGPQRAADGWASATTIVRNRIESRLVGVRLRNSWNATVADNVIEHVGRHAIKVDGRPGHRTVLADNRIQGSGISSVSISHDAAGVEQRGNLVRWDQPLDRDVSRALSWIVGPALWMLVVLAALLGVPARISSSARLP